MEWQKRAKVRGAASPATLDPEARARLDRQIDGVAAALETDAGLAALQDQVTADREDPDWDAHLMEALGTLSHPAIPPLLAALFGEARDKVRRKALKKTLHRLKTRGVPFSEDLLPREAASFGAPWPGVAKVVSPIFGLGETYVILEGPPEVLGGNFLVSRVSDREGFKECVLLSLKRQQQAEVWERFREQGLDQWFSPPPAYAVSRLEEAYTQAGGAGPGVVQYKALQEKIFQHWGRPETAPDLERELPPLSPGELPALLERGRDLATDPIFHAFLPGPEEIAPWLAKLREVQDSPLVLSDQQKQVRIDGVLDEATRSLYPVETRSDWGRTPPDYGLLPPPLRPGGRRLPGRPGGGGRPDRPGAERPYRRKPFPEKPGALYRAPGLGDAATREPAPASGLIAPPGEAGLIRR